MSQENIDRWQAQALALDAKNVRTAAMPVATMLQEAAGVAHFVERYWSAAADATRPGLESVATVLPQAIADEIRSLGDACRTLHTRVLFPNGESGARKPLLERAAYVAAELRSALEFLLDDGVDEPADEAWRAAKDRASDDGSQASLAQSLYDYAGIAETLRERLAKIGLDAGMIDEARTLASSLVAQGGPVVGRAASEVIGLRDRMITLLSDRMGAVRRAARYVFRAQPELVKQVTSAYERRRRGASKRRDDGSSDADGGAGSGADTAAANSAA